MKSILIFSFIVASFISNAQHYEYDTTHVQMPPLSVTADSIYLSARVQTLVKKAPVNKFQQVDIIKFSVSINSTTSDVIELANTLGSTYSFNTYPNNSSSSLEFEVAGTNPLYDLSNSADSIFTSFQLITKIKNVPLGKFEQSDNGIVGNSVNTPFNILLQQIPAAGIALKNKLYPNIP